MALKQYEIAFKLAAKMSGDFPKSFKNASDAVEKLGDHMQSLNSDSKKIAGLVAARKAVAESSKEYGQARRKVAELGKAMSQTSQPAKELVQSFNLAKLALDKAKTSLQKNRTALRELDAEAGTASVSLAGLVKRQKDLEQATEAAYKAQQKAAKLQPWVDLAQKGQDGLNKALDFSNSVNAGIVKIGGAANATALVAGGAWAKVGADYQAAMARVQASTGASAEQMKQIEEAARAVFSSGMGESFDEVARAMSTIKQVGGLDGKDLESATKNAMALGKTFDMDVNETARATSALMKNFGIDGQKAFDLIAYAAQNGANKNGDLLDTFNEYAVQYQALGFTAEQFAAHLVKGAEDGAFSIDKVGDAIKEFNIRAKDGSKSSMEAFAALGLNGQKATQMFAAGGQSAQVAFAEVVKRLSEMEDPVARNAAGVALFGTQFEDLEVKALEGFKAIQGSLPQIEGTMQQVSRAISSDLGSQLRIVSRSFMDLLLPAADSAAKAITEQMPKISKALAALAPQIEALSQAFTKALPVITQWFNKSLSGAMSFVSFVLENFNAIATAVAYAGSAFLIFRGVFQGLKVVVTVTKWVLMARQAFITYRVSAAAAVVASKATAVAMNLLSVAAKSLGAAMKFLMANPIVLFLAGLVAAGVAVYKNWDELKAMAVSAAQIISDAWSSAMTSIQGFFANTFDSLASIMKGPINTIIAMINSIVESINGMAFNVPDWVPAIGGQKFGVELPKIPQLAEGGIATQPTLATIAEAGEAEAVIPLSKLSTMLQPLPATSGEGAGGTVINFSPVINVQGGGADVAGAVQTGLRSGYEEFRANMQRFMTEQKRLSFA